MEGTAYRTIICSYFVYKHLRIGLGGFQLLLLKYLSHFPILFLGGGGISPFEI